MDVNTFSISSKLYSKLFSNYIFGHILMFYEVQQHISLFEDFIASKDKRNFIDNLNNPTQKLFLNVLTTPIDNLESFHKDLNKLDISQKFREAILKFKLHQYLEGSKTISSNKILEQLKSLHKQYLQLNHEKPANARRQARASEDEDFSHRSSNQILSKDLHEFINQKVIEDSSYLRQLQPLGISLLSQKTLLKLDLKTKECFFQQNRYLSILSPSLLNKMFQEFTKEYKKEHKHLEGIENISFPFQKLTKQQLNTLAKHNEDLFHSFSFCKEWITQNYSHFSAQYVLADSSPLQKEKYFFDKLLKIKEELAGHPKCFSIKMFEHIILTEILATEVELSVPKESRIHEYLNNQLSMFFDYPYFTEKFMGKFSKKITHSKQVLEFMKMFKNSNQKFRGSARGATQLVEDYIIQLLKHKDDKKVSAVLEKMSEIIQMKYLKKLQTKAKLIQSIVCEDATDFWSHNELVQFRDKKQISISQRNPHIFKSTDGVVLNVILKNVKEVEIKVYQLNLLKEYLTNNSAQNRSFNDINLSYFSPTSSDVFVNSSNNPFELKSVDIDIKDIPKRMGTFVVDLQGEGIVSRAIIRKGAIVCLDKYSEQGQELSFYDQEGKPLTAEEGLTIWVQKRKINMKTGNNFSSEEIEHDRRSQNTEIIASIGCFAQKFIKNTKQSYTISISAIYNSESFIKQNKAKLLLKASLKVNGESISLKKLRGAKAVVNQLTNKIISSSNIFDIAQWKDNQEQVIEFFPQTDLNSITVQLQGQIADKSNSSVQSNTISILISSEEQIEEGAIEQPYLRQTEDSSYQLTLKGKNGQAVSDKEIVLNFSIKGTSQQETLRFVTDSQGNIPLGKLPLVKSINYLSGSIQRNWTIDQIKGNFNYDRFLYAFPGEAIDLPVPRDWSAKDVFLLEHSSEGQRNDKTQHVIVKDGMLSFTVSNKQSHTYTLTLIPISVQIIIKVLGDSCRWRDKHGNKDIVVNVQEGTVGKVKRRSKLSNISVSGVQQQSKENQTICTLELKGCQNLSQSELAELRIHVLATNYLSPLIAGAFSSSNYFVESSITQESRQLNKSLFLSNKNLSEEAAYIRNRQKTKGRIGNNLQKPGIFLRRLQVRETSDVVGELQGEGKFDVQAANKQKAERRWMENYRPLIRTFPYITKHNSFLKTSGYLIHNQALSTAFSVPKGYSHIQVYLITAENGTKGTFSLSTKESAVKDIRFKGPAGCTEGKAWNISRQVYNIGPSEKIQFSKKCEFKAVTLAQVFEYAEKIIFPGKNQKLYAWKDCFIKWKGYSQQQKLKLYNKYYCHELNSFLKYKDEPFFEKIVRPFIACKLNKSLIDLCLLDDPDVKNYLMLRQLLRLNNFECALLVHTLVKLNLKKQAEKVVERMELVHSKSLPFKVKSNNFDYIINSFAGRQKVVPLKGKEEALVKVALKAKLKRQPSEMALSQCRRLSESEDDSMRENLSEDMSLPKPEKQEVAGTKEYTELTYYYQRQQRYPIHQHRLINSPFWAQLAKHFLEGGKGNFISAAFTEFTNGLEVMISAAFIPGLDSGPYELQDAGQNFKLKSSIPLALFLKEQKEYPYQQKDGVYIYQTMTTKSTLEPNKEIVATEIRVGQQYFLSTIFSNSTSQEMDLQILCPVPEGSIPIKSKEVTIIQNTLGPFKTDVFKQAIYFPAPGLFQLSSANILDMRAGLVIARSPANLPVAVMKAKEGKKLDTFEDVIQFGSKNQILEFIKTKNIFSSQVFKPQLILWMLNDQAFYDKIITVLRERFYFNYSIWKFSLLHGDSQGIRQFLNLCEFGMNPHPNDFVEKSTMERLFSIGNEAFEYYPYFQKRTHRYASQNRSSIKCVDLKETYIKFLMYLISSAAENDPKNKIAYAYYLILQDRLIQADKIVSQLSEAQKNICEIQVDYIRCYLDMGLNGQRCQLARSIAPKYADYPIAAWRRLFQEICDTLKVPPPDEGKTEETIQTKVGQLENGDISIRRSLNRQIKVEIFPTDMELFFSEHAFQMKQAISNYSVSRPSRQIFLSATSPETEIVIKKEEFAAVSNPYIEMSEHSTESHKKIKSLLWSDPRITVKIDQQSGIAQVFVSGNRSSGSYVKVFILKKGAKRPSSNAQYYVDGYTDIAGKFRYALTDLQSIEEFALLIVTEIGAVVKYTSPPNVKGQCSKKQQEDDFSQGASDEEESPVIINRKLS